MIILSLHDTDMQLKYDQVKKVKNRAEFYIFRFFCFVLFCFVLIFLLDQGQKSN